MAINWGLYDHLRNGKGLKIHTGTDGYVFVEEDGGMGKVLEIYDFERISEHDVADKLRMLGFEI